MTQIEREIEAMGEEDYDNTSLEKELPSLSNRKKMLKRHYQEQFNYDLLSDVTVTTLNRGVIPATKVKTGDYLRAYDGKILEVIGCLFYNGRDVIPCRCENGNTVNYSPKYVY